MKRTLIYITFFFLLFGTAHGQTLKAFLEQAELDMLDKDYYNAAYHYKAALEFDTTNLEIRNKSANAFQLVNGFSRAESNFEYIFANDSLAEYPLTSFHLGEIKQRLGKYKDSEFYYKQYLVENENDEAFYTDKAKNEIIALEWAQKQIKDESNGVEIKLDDNGINTPYSEYSPIKIDSQLYYASHRFEIEQEDTDTVRIFSKVLINQNQGENTLLDSSFNDSGPNIGNLTFNQDQSKVYYTICEYQNSYDLTCDIYSRNIDASGNWEEAYKLPLSINDTLSTNTQPSIGYDSHLDKEVLYFVSNRKDGKGGLDIWYSVITDNNYDDPINLSIANTKLDEVTPFFHVSTNKLFFSSNNLVGMGGFDIYSTQISKSNFSEPVNIGHPQNSSFDDIYYFLNDDGTEAYLSSNKIDTTGLNKSYFLDNDFESCCYDIYRVDIEETIVNLKVLTFDKLTKEPLLGTRVRIIDTITGETLYDSLDPLNNAYDFKLKWGREYKIISEREDYETDETSLLTSEFSKLEDIIKKIYLEPKKIFLDVYTFDKQSLETLEGVTVTLIDLTNPELEPIVVEDISRNFHSFEIIPGRKYELQAKKPGYDKVTQIVNINTIENGRITEKLYLTKRENNPFGIKDPLLVSLDVYTYDKQSLDLLNGVTVTLINLNSPNAKPIVVLDPNGNFYQFEIIEGGKYELQATKKGYDLDTQIVNTNIVEDGKITKKLYLTKLGDLPSNLDPALINLEVFTFEEQSLEPLKDVKVTLIDLNNLEREPIVVQDLNNNYYKFEILRNGNYELQARKPGYNVVIQKVNTKIINNGKVTEKLYLVKRNTERLLIKDNVQIRLDVFTFDKQSLKSLEGATVTLIDLNKPNADPIVVRDLNNHYYIFELLTGGKYKLEARKPGYGLVTQIVNMGNIKNGIITEKLYLLRREGYPMQLNEYLPVTVYFDNDQPGRRSKKMYTDLSYSETYPDYYKRKGEFLKQTNRNKKEGVRTFFEKEVKGGNDTLKLFIRALHERLVAGDIIEVSLKGFASPRAASKYNLALGQRRIWALKNEIRNYDNRILEPFIKSGKLKVAEISFGEEIAPSGISDSFAHPQLSVYSVEASSQRKAEIVRVKILN